MGCCRWWQTVVIMCVTCVNAHQVPPRKYKVFNMVFTMSSKANTLYLTQWYGLGSSPIQVRFSGTCRMTFFGDEPHGQHPISVTCISSKQSSWGVPTPRRRQYRWSPQGIWASSSLEDPPWPTLAADRPRVSQRAGGQRRRGEEGTQGEMQPANKEACNNFVIFNCRDVKSKLNSTDKKFATEN